MAKLGREIYAARECGVCVFSRHHLKGGRNTRRVQRRGARAQGLAGAGRGPSGGRAGWSPSRSPGPGMYLCHDHGDSSLRHRRFSGRRGPKTSSLPEQRDAEGKGRGMVDRLMAGPALNVNLLGLVDGCSRAGIEHVAVLVGTARCASWSRMKGECGGAKACSFAGHFGAFGADRGFGGSPGLLWRIILAITLEKKNRAVVVDHQEKTSRPACRHRSSATGPRPEVASSRVRRKGAPAKQDSQQRPTRPASSRNGDSVSASSSPDQSTT